uniref:Uncharacterized protein n=1 Tax=Schistocephalus solidus TaxID=70667 RepID=A0A0X3NPK2_SCHSO
MRVFVCVCALFVLMELLNVRQWSTTSSPTTGSAEIRLLDTIQFRHFRQFIGDIIPGVAIETLTQATLVKVVTNEADATSQDEEPIKSAELYVLVGLTPSEDTTMTEQIHHCHANETVDIEDQSWSLCGCNLFYLEGVIHEGRCREVGASKVCKKAYPCVRIGDRLDPVTNTHDETASRFRGLHKFRRRETAVEGSGEVTSCGIQGTTETIPDGEQA